MKIQDLKKVKTIGEVSEYVQNNARYHKDAPDLKYSVRHPNQYGTNSVSSGDTWDLVEQLCKLYGIKLSNKKSTKKSLPPNEPDEYLKWRMG